MNDIDFKGFKPSTLDFLQELRINNNRNWFKENKERYENDVLTPAFNYISAMSNPLEKVSPHFTAIPKRVGGSLMRIYRDTRFSKDKTPYKTNIGIQFRHQLGKDVHAPGYYIHIEPGEYFFGAGIFHPASDVLLKIRQYIIENPQLWIKVRDNKSFKENFVLFGDSLKNAPRGFPIDHELIVGLKRKDFIGTSILKETDVIDNNFVGLTTDLIRKSNPLMKFLCDALRVSF